MASRGYRRVHFDMAMELERYSKTVLNNSCEKVFWQKFGYTNLKPNTKKNYKKHFHGLKAFFSMIGDYSFLAVLMDRPPHPFCPSMDPTSLALFMRLQHRDYMKPEIKMVVSHVIAQVVSMQVRTTGYLLVVNITQHQNYERKGN